MKGKHSTLIIWIAFLVIAIFIFQQSWEQNISNDKIPFSDVIALAFTDTQSPNKIVSMEFKGNEIEGKYSDGRVFKSYGMLDPNLAKDLSKAGVKVSVKKEEGTPILVQIFIQTIPILILVALVFFFMRQIQAGGGRAMSFSKSKARMLNENSKKVTFKDVAGVDEGKEELEEIIDFLKDPKKFTSLGGRIPKGVLLMGPPGTGKTLLARAIAGEAGVPFFSISGSDFVEMFVGIGASRVRDLFDQGKKHAPCIIFIDEIDAVGRHRGAGLGGGHDEREQTLNQLLVEMDGFESNEGVILVAATNRPDVLDPALLRPGRFDRRVVVQTPDIKGRKGILEVHTRNTPLDEGVNLEIIAKGTPGFTGADLENVVNEAALYAARNNCTKISIEHLEVAKDKVLMGPARKSLYISDKEKRNTAFHESGHTVVTYLLPDADPVHKVTIIPRGLAMGITQMLPTEDKRALTETYLRDTICGLMGGRAAEQLIFNTLSTGASNDIDRATELARKMVCNWGMSEKVGPITLGKVEEHPFLGKELATHQSISQDMMEKIDNEINKIVNTQYEKALNLLKENSDILNSMAEILIKKESLDSRDIEAVMTGKPVPIDNNGSCLSKNENNPEKENKKEENSELTDNSNESKKNLKSEPSNSHGIV